MSRASEGRERQGRDVEETAGERRLRRGAELLLERELLTGPAPLPDFASLLSERTPRRRWTMALSALGAAVVMGGIVWSWKDRGPVSYVVVGEAAIVGTRIEAAASRAPNSARRPKASAGAKASDVKGSADEELAGADGGRAEPAQIRFSEGTVVTLGPGAKVDVIERTGRGALLSLDRGEARFSVVHRSGGRWTVVSGPFAVEVTGTEFTADWSPEAGRMAIDLRSGAVRVRGASAGGAVELHAGERLVANAADHRVTVSPAGEWSLGATSSAAASAPVASALVASALVDRRLASGAPGSAMRAPSDQTSPASAPSPPSALSARASAPARLARVVVEGSSRSPGPHREVAIWSPRDGGRLELREHPVPSLENSAQSARPAAPEGPRVDPSPFASSSVPVVPQSLTLGGGGLFCVTVPAQYSFEQPVAGLSAPPTFTAALANPRLDRSHSWCGESSVRMDANFDDSGRQNFFGRFPNETGQLLVKLDHPANLTGRTVTMHVFVEGPWDVRFSAELAVVDHGRWVSSPASRGLTPGRWWTVSHRFEADNRSGLSGSSNPWPFPNGGTSPASEVDRMALAIRSTGERRTWKGAVFVDDISWR